MLADVALINDGVDDEDGDAALLLEERLPVLRLNDWATAFIFGPPVEGGVLAFAPAFRFLSIISLSCRTKTPCRERHLK